MQNNNQNPLCPRCMTVVNFNMQNCPICGCVLNFQNNNSNRYSHNKCQNPNPNYNYNQQYYQPPNSQFLSYVKKKKSKSVFFIIMISVLSILFLMSVIYFIGKTYSNFNMQGNQNGYFSSNKTNSHGYSDEELSKIKEGMSYARVSAIIGGDGILVENSETPQGEPYLKYFWINEKGDSNSLFITFKEGIVTEFLVAKTPKGE